MSETAIITSMKTNVLYCGDNLDILRHHIPDESILTLNAPTKDMITEAAASGFYESDFWKKKYPRLQILTVLDILKGKRCLDLRRSLSPSSPFSSSATGGGQ